MRRLFILLVILLSASQGTRAQDDMVLADTFRLNTGPCEISSGAGSPEFTVVGNVCDMYINTVDGVIWSKWTGTKTTSGWMVGFNTSNRINGNTNITGYIGHPDYVSQLSRWRIDDLGGADFRYGFFDELHAKSFIVDLEQALAGGQIITKSVAVLAANFIVPVAGGTAQLFVEDLPSAENATVFQNGDTVRLRAFTRTAGSLTIADAFGVVTSYVDQAGGVQRWTFTRSTAACAGSAITGSVIQADALVLDYGVSGNGFIESNAIDGAYGINSPYTQTATWTTCPTSANTTLRSRVGNLRGITGVDGEYGAMLGTYIPSSSSGQYIRVSNQAVELHGVNLSMWDGSTRTFYMDRSVPSLAMGSPTPGGFSSGTGCWQGKDAGVYKWRCGNPAGDRIEWNGTNLNVVGTVTVTGGGSYVPVGGAAADVRSGVAVPTGAGLFLGSDKMGYYNGGAWTTYMDNAGNFYLGGTGGALQWNGSTLSIVGSGSFTGTVTASAGTIGGWTLGATSLTSGGVGMASSGTYAFWAGHVTPSSAPFQVTTAGALVATSATITGTITGSSITGSSASFGGTDLDSNGISTSSGTSSSNGYKFSGTSNSGMFYTGGYTFFKAQTGYEWTIGAGLQMDLTTTHFSSVNGHNLGSSGGRWGDLWVEGGNFSNNVNMDDDLLVDDNIYILSLAGGGRRYLCMENNGAITADNTAC